MKALGMPLWLLGAVVAVVIAAAGSYYAFFASNDAGREHGLPSYAVGAENLVMTQVYLGQPDNYSSETRRSDAVVEGVVNELLPSKWTTADNQPPEEITREVVKDLDTHVRTIAVLDVEKVYKGESIGETLNFSFRGGRVGDTVYIHEWNEVFTEGARVILFLDLGDTGSPAKKVDSQGFAPLMHLVVNDDGTIRGPVKEVDRATLLRQIQPDSDQGR